MGGGRMISPGGGRDSKPWASQLRKNTYLGFKFTKIRGEISDFATFLSSKH
jgi:hypothetical protein